MRLARQLGLLAAAFAAGTGLAALLSADNTGIAMSFGQIAFAATLVWFLLRG